MYDRNLNYILISIINFDLAVLNILNSSVFA